MRQTRSLFFLFLSALIAGCSAPAVQRSAEVARFRDEVSARVGKLDISPAKPLSMQQCVDIALMNSIDFKVRELQASIQNEKVREEFSKMLPNAQASYGWTRRSNQNLVQVGAVTSKAGDRTNQNFSITAMMPVIDWGVARYGYLIAKDRKRQELLLLDRSAQTLARDVRIAYARLASFERQEQLARVGLLAARELLKVAQSTEREGLAARADTAQVEAGLAQAALVWTNIRRSSEQARLDLEQLMSLPAGTRLAIDNRLPPLRPLVKGDEIGKLEDSALRSRPELFAQDAERHAAANTVRQRFAEFFPRIDGVASFNWSSSSMAVNPSFFQYGVQVTDSLLDGGGQIWRYREAKKTANVEQERALLLALGILYDVDFRVLQMYTAYDLMVANEAIVRSQQEALKQAVSNYIEGLETGTDTVRALAEMYLARLQLDAAQTDYQAAWIGLETAALPGTAPAAPEGEPAGKTIAPYRPTPALDTLQQMLEAAPPVDLHQYPELKELLKVTEPRESRP